MSRSCCLLMTDFLFVVPIKFSGENYIYKSICAHPHPLCALLADTDAKNLVIKEKTKTMSENADVQFLKAVV